MQIMQLAISQCAFRFHIEWRDLLSIFLNFIWFLFLKRTIICSNGPPIFLIYIFLFEALPRFFGSWNNSLLLVPHFLPRTVSVYCLVIATVELSEEPLFNVRFSDSGYCCSGSNKKASDEKAFNKQSFIGAQTTLD